ncbi:putative lipase [Handroanthus impetiginosus]|uniref:Putative lipase n=1 Tax=Handroanthus impetiginosus TaxID=429701 RepID=A0A2G9I7S1_9LAMI|nr:putative lipase [Handroanthus impetiginosus]
MATSLSKTALTFTKPLLHPQNQCSSPDSNQVFQPVSWGNHNHPKTKLLTKPARAVSETNDSLSSFIQKLEKQQQSVAKNKQRKQRKLSDCWREILGEDDWIGLLDPMDPFTRREFFDQLGMAEDGYDITRYLYATSNINLPNFFNNSRWPKVWSKNAKWIGYIAVSNDETSRKLGRSDVCIAWRGTVTRLEWVADLMDFLRPISSDKIPCPDPTVSVEEQILTEVNRLINEVYPHEEMSVTVTGHSLGGALSLISGYDIVETGINVRADATAVPVCVFPFASPRVGNVRFKSRLELLGLKVLRVVNVHDIVPKSPGLFFNEKVHPFLMKMAENFPWSYSHVGVELALDHKKSPFLREDGDLVCAHNLEAYLHLLEGYQGTGERFVLANGRDYALVNKACDFLKDEYEIPPNWRQDHNKGMVRNKDGRWVQQERPLVDHDHLSHDTHHHLKEIG